MPLFDEAIGGTYSGEDWFIGLPCVIITRSIINSIVTAVTYTIKCLFVVYIPVVVKTSLH